jgi:hypothetical protein
METSGNGLPIRNKTPRISLTLNPGYTDIGERLPNDRDLSVHS